MPEYLMFDVDVYDVNTNKLLFKYKAYLVPDKGDYLYNITHGGDMKVKKVVCFYNLPSNFDVYVEVPNA